MPKDQGFGHTNDNMGVLSPAPDRYAFDRGMPNSVPVIVG